MSVHEFAYLFSLSGVLVAFLLAYLVERRYEPGFLRWWTRGYGVLLLGMAGDLLSSRVSIPAPWAALTPSGLLVSVAAWCWLEAAWELKRRPAASLPAWLWLGPIFALELLAAGQGISGRAIALLPHVLNAASLLWLGTAIARTRHRVAGGRISWLASSLWALGLWTLAGPFFPEAWQSWFVPWVSAVLHIGNGIGVVVFWLDWAALRLREHNEKLQELDGLKMSFLSTVSHELRTPLTSMMGYLELMHDQIGGPLSEMQQEFVGRMRGESRHLGELINSLLDTVQLESGKLRLRSEALDLHALLAEACPSLEVQARAKGLAFEFVLPPTLPRVWADGARVSQTLRNLVENAVKFTDAGGKVEVGVAADDRFVTVSVRDTGIGIPHGQLTRIFEPFVQADGSLTRRHGGSGLGLAIASRLIEGMGGTLTCSSEPGVGSCFVFTLPQVQVRLVPSYLELEA